MRLIARSQKVVSYGQIDMIEHRCLPMIEQRLALQTCITSASTTYSAKLRLCGCALGNIQQARTMRACVKRLAVICRRGEGLTSLLAFPSTAILASLGTRRGTARRRLRSFCGSLRVRQSGS